MGQTERSLNKAGRLAALLLLSEQGQLEGRTLQELANLLGGVDRSTIMRDLRDLPTARRYYNSAAAALATLAE